MTFDGGCAHTHVYVSVCNDAFWITEITWTCLLPPSFSPYHVITQFPETCQVLQCLYISYSFIASTLLTANEPVPCSPNSKKSYFGGLLQSDNIYSVCPGRSKALVKLDARKKRIWIICIEQIMDSQQQKGLLSYSSFTKCPVNFLQSK